MQVMIPSYLSLAIAPQIAVEVISSKFYYCNSLFHNMHENDLARLQRVENCFARVATREF